VNEAPERLTDLALQQALAGLPGWRRQGARLCIGYRFASFRAAVAFTQQLAELAEAQQHHPEWTVTYRFVDLSTTTHDAGGLTGRDVELARAIAELAARMAGKLRHDAGGSDDSGPVDAGCSRG
jgi:4a-hydroxytetrahydrobiopterin dehydratase